MGSDEITHSYTAKMGGKLKSLSFSKARKASSRAVRKLFGRESPAFNGGSCEPVVENPKKAGARVARWRASWKASANGANSGPPADAQIDSDAFVTSQKQHRAPVSAHQRSDDSHPSTIVAKPQPAGDDSYKSNGIIASRPELPPDTTDDTTMRPLQAKNLQQQKLPPKKSGEYDWAFAAAAAFGKENRAPAPAVKPLPAVEDITKGIRDVSLIGESQLLTDQAPLTPEIVPEIDEETKAEQAKNLAFMEEALEMARLALRTNETPVGCVLVHEDKVIARGMNATNVTRNGTRHAEFMALSALLSVSAKTGPRPTCLKPKFEVDSDDDASTISRQPDEGNEDGRKGHLYPYGMKEHPDEVVYPKIISECTLYVTVEPCIMCASLLRQMGIKKVYFGAVNDKFGGTGGVFSIHANSEPVREDGQTASAHPQTPPTRLPSGGQVLGTSFPPSGGDGGNVERGFEIEGGWGRDDAVALLRRFYVQENERAPIPRKKEGRAARLAALMQDDSASETGDSGNTRMGLNGDDTTCPSLSDGGDGRRSSSSSSGPDNFRNREYDE